MTASKTKTNSSRPSFPQRVYNVLKLSEDQHQEHIISWMNNGTAFKVHDLDEFERDMLPKYFKTQKYATFTRALCAYGFTCVRTGRQTGIYSHPKFTRSESLEDLSRIKRLRSKTTPMREESATHHNRTQSTAELCEALKGYMSTLQFGIQDETSTFKLTSLECNDDFEPIPWSPQDFEPTPLSSQCSPMGHNTVPYHSAFRMIRVNGSVAV